jgi:YVTN family beta-propeller protein
VLGQFSLSESPWGVAVDPMARLVYAATFGGGTLRILAADTLAPVHLATFGLDAQLTNVAVVPGRSTALTVSHSRNELYVVHGPTGAVVATQPTGGSGAWGVAYDPQLNRAYVSHRDSGSITTMDGNAGWAQIPGQTLQPCGPGGQAYGLAVNVIKRWLYIACAPAGNVNEVKVYTMSEGGLNFQASVPVGNGGDDGGGGIAVNTSTGNVFFTNSTSNTVSVINSTTHQVIATLATGSTPFGAAVDPVTGKVFVGNKTSNTLTVLDDTFPANPTLPAISVSKQTTCATDQITVTGRNFPAAGGLGYAEIYFNNTRQATVPVQAGGNFVATIGVPANPGGLQTVTAVKLLQPWVHAGALTRTPLLNLPIIFLPGLAGSELRTGGAFNLLTWPNRDLCVSLPLNPACLLPEDHIYLPNELVWLGPRGIATAFVGRWRYLDALALDPDGRTPRADMIGIRPNIVVGEPLWNIAGLQPVYEPLDQFLEAQGYVDGQTLFYFPYDWRKDYIQLDQALDEMINLALQRSGKEKVILMAHSTGGVVARNYLLRRGTAKVDQLISMGTPYIGSPVSARAMEVGDDMGLGAHFGDFGIGLHPKQGKALAQNFAGLYDLLPSSLWFTPSPADRGSPPPPYLVRTRLQSGQLILEPLDYAQSTAWLASRRNATLLNDALTFQNQGIGNLSLLTDQYYGQRIASTGRATPSAIEYSPRQICARILWLNFCVSSPELAFARKKPFGDDTIALRSAIGGNLPAGDDRFYVLQGVPHMELPGSPAVHALLSRMLRGSMCSGGGMPPGLEDIEALSGSEIILMGGAELHVYDTAGNHAGPLPDQPAGIEDQLDGVDYSLGDDSVMATVTGGGPYTLRLEGNSLDGAALLRVSRIVDDIAVETTIFAGLPITGTTAATFTLAGPGVAPSPLTFRYTPSDPVFTDPGVVLSGAAAQDLNPPVTTLTRDIQTNLVTVTANDGLDGSGVAGILISTEYPPVNYIPYSGPTVIPASVHCISALANDHAGNASLAESACRTWLPALQR